MALKLMAEIGIDGSGLSRGLGAIKSQIAGAFSVGAVTALAKKTIEYAGHINDLADRLGVTTDYLQEMQYVIKQNGGSVDELTATFEKLGAARIAALNGDTNSKKVQADFAKLGVSVGDLQTQGTEGLLDKIAEQFKQLGNNDEIKTAFKAIGGKGAGVLVPSFISGLEKGRQSARDAGAVIAEDTLLQLDEIGDKFDQLGIRMMSGIAPGISALADALGILGDKIGQSQSAVGEFIGNVWGLSKSALNGDVERREAMLKKYREQLDAKVSSGAITKQEADSKFNNARNKSWLGQSGAALGTMSGVVKAQQKTEAEQKIAADLAEAERKAKIEARKNKPNFVYEKNAPEAEAESAKKPRNSDSLLSVGNFLGASAGSTIVAIAQQQLTEVRKTNRLIQELIGMNGEELSWGVPTVK